jgi:hypothetical protein
MSVQPPQERHSSKIKGPYPVEHLLEQNAYPAMRLCRHELRDDQVCGLAEFSLASVICSFTVDNDIASYRIFRYMEVYGMVWRIGNELDGLSHLKTMAKGPRTEG